MARSKIIVDFVQDNIPLSKMLLRLKTLIFELHNDEILEWINYEINGYDETKVVPKYRKIIGDVTCDIFQFNRIFQNVCLPLTYNNDYIIEITTCSCKDSVSAIERMMNKEDGSLMSIIPMAAYPYLQNNVKINGNIQNAKVVYAVHQFSDIYSAIKNKVLDILLTLEQECGNLDNYDLNITETSREKIIQIIQNIIFEDNSITIGNNNKIKDTKILNKTNIKDEKVI